MIGLSSSAFALPQLASIEVSGVDARSFLQGQLSFDMNGLTPHRVELATCNSPQGRVQAVLWLVERTDGIALILPQQTAADIATRLRKYVLRAKARIETAGLSIAGSLEDPGVESVRTHIETAGVSAIRWPGQGRTLLIVPAGIEVRHDPIGASQWHREDIRAGLPQVYGATNELFVAQMLNADLLGGIGFEKGCYTGQEIIARMHFRGSVKRRMFLFRASCAPPAPGTRVIAGGVHAGDVVDAASAPEGTELLAVINLSQIDAALELDVSGNPRLEQQPLPYAVS